jgi:hypothetical protein
MSTGYNELNDYLLLHKKVTDQTFQELVSDWGPRLGCLLRLSKTDQQVRDRNGWHGMGACISDPRFSHHEAYTRKSVIHFDDQNPEMYKLKPGILCLSDLAEAFKFKLLFQTITRPRFHVRRLGQPFVATVIPHL